MNQITISCFGHNEETNAYKVFDLQFSNSEQLTFAVTKSTYNKNAYTITELTTGRNALHSGQQFPRIRDYIEHINDLEKNIMSVLKKYPTIKAFLKTQRRLNK